MADKVRKELLGCISVPSYVKPRSLRKQNALKFSGSISPIKSNKCCKDTSSDISSPSKYLKLHSLLSQIEENCENDEKNELYSDASEESSVSPASHSNLLLLPSADIVTIKSSERTCMVNVFQCNESASEIRRPILNTNFDPLKFRYNPSETKVNGSFLLKFDNDSSCNIISLETKAEEYLQTLGRSIRYVNCSRSNSCNLSPDSITKTKTNKKTIKKRVVKKKRGKKQSSKRIQEWKRLSQKLDEIEQELDHKDLKEKVKKDTFSNDFENFSWTTYKNSDIIDSEKDCNEEKKEIGTKISKYGLKQKEKACFYKNSKFKSNEFNKDNIQIKNSKRRRIMTFEEDNYSNLNSVIEQVEEIKNIRKKSTNEGEIITLRKCSNPTKLSFGTTMNTVSDKCNSVINSPNYFDSTNSEALQDNVTSESSFNQLRKKRKMKYKLRNLKINPDRKLSCGSVSLPMSSMLAILDGLKEIEEEMDK